MLNAQIVDIIVTGSCSSHLIFSTVRSVTSSCFHNHKLTLPLFFYLPFALSPSHSLSFCSAHWYKYTKMWPDREGHNWLPVQCVSASCSVTQKHDLLEADVAVCLDVLNFTLCPKRFNLFTCSNMQSCMETLRFAPCSLAQTKSLERDHRLFMSWAFVLLIHFILTV